MADESRRLGSSLVKSVRKLGGSLRKSASGSGPGAADERKRSQATTPMTGPPASAARSRSARAPCFGSALDELGGTRALRLVNSCVELIKQPEALADPGLFRSSPVSQSAVRAAIERIEADGDGALSLAPGEPASLGATVLKRWLTALPTPLIPAAAAAETTPQQALLALPPTARTVACAVLLAVGHVLDVAEAEGRAPTAEGMAKVLTPALLYGVGGPTSDDRDVVARQVTNDSKFVLSLLDLTEADLRSIASGRAPGPAVAVALRTAAPAVAPSHGGPPGAIVVEISSVALDEAVAKKFKAVRIEVDMPGPGEPIITPARPLICEAGQEGLANLDFDQEYDAAPHTALGGALAAALKEGGGEADMLFALYGVDAQGNETELGAARCALEELLASGADMLDETLGVLDENNREIARLICSVSALTALQGLKNGWGTRGETAARAPAPSRAGRATGGEVALAAADSMLVSEVANRELRASFEDLRAHSEKVLALARAVKEKEPASEAPKALLRRPNGEEGLVLGNEDIVQEVRAAMAAWDQATGGSMEELLSGGVLSTSQRKLLVHATTEVRYAKRAWSAHKKELRREREDLAEEIVEFSRKLNVLRDQGMNKSENRPDEVEAMKGADTCCSGVEISDNRQDVVRSGVARKGPQLKLESSAPTPKPVVELPAVVEVEPPPPPPPPPVKELAAFSSQANEYLQVRARVRHHPSSTSSTEAGGTKPPPTNPAPPQPDLRASHGQGLQSHGAPPPPPESVSQAPQHKPQPPPGAPAGPPIIHQHATASSSNQGVHFDPYSTARFMSAAAAAHLLRQHAGASHSGNPTLDSRAAVEHARRMTYVLGGAPNATAGVPSMQHSYSAVQSPWAPPINAFVSYGSAQAAANSGFALPPAASMHRSWGRAQAFPGYAF